MLIITFFSTDAAVLFGSLLGILLSGLILYAIGTRFLENPEDSWLLLLFFGTLFIVFGLFIVVMSIFLIFFKQFLFYSFDPIGAKVRGLNVSFLNYLFLIILSLAIIGSLQTVGIILVLSMLIIPSAAAKLITKTFVNSIIFSVAFGVVASISGLYLSYFFNLPSGPSMSIVATLIFIITFLISKLVNPVLTYLNLDI